MKKFDSNPAYVGNRPDIEALICPKTRFVLDVGCSTGMLGAAIKARTGATVFGIELSEDMACDAMNCIDKVFVGDAVEIIGKGVLDGYLFDAIVFADVLEHLIDPWVVLKNATKYLSKEGCVIASVPNVRHFDTIYQLAIKGRWPYRKRGIHDWNHLRFFTKSTVTEMFEGSGLTIEMLEASYRVIEKPHKLNSFAQYLAIPGIRDFLAFQYLVRARLKR